LLFDRGARDPVSRRNLLKSLTNLRNWVPEPRIDVRGKALSPLDWMWLADP